MRKHHSKSKGDIGLSKTIDDLVSNKGYGVSLPISEHLPYDLIADADGKLYRIQAKYRKSGTISSKTSWNDKNGNHSNNYGAEDFDFFSLYLPELNKVLYVPWLGTFKTLSIRSELPNKWGTEFYWYEDFIDFSKTLPPKRTLSEFTDKRPVIPRQSRESARKVTRPTKEELAELIESTSWVGIGRLYGVSDNAVRKWAKSYGIL